MIFQLSKLLNFKSHKSWFDLVKASQKKWKNLIFTLAPNFCAGVAACFLVTIKLRSPYLVAPIDCPPFTTMVAQKDPKARSENPDPSSSDEDAEGEQRRQELIRENQLLREGTVYLFSSKSCYLPQTCFTFIHRNCEDW